jgi:septal ring factor EnvC (AmiA/AmiB activator)
LKFFSFSISIEKLKISEAEIERKNRKRRKMDCSSCDLLREQLEESITIKNSNEQELFEAYEEIEFLKEKIAKLEFKNEKLTQILDQVIKKKKARIMNKYIPIMEVIGEKPFLENCQHKGIQYDL